MHITLRYGVENPSEIIRRDVPKRSTQCDYINKDITMIIDDINHTSKNSPGYFTPQEQFSTLSVNHIPLWFPLVELNVAFRF